MTYNFTRKGDAKMFKRLCSFESRRSSVASLQEAMRGDLDGEIISDIHDYLVKYGAKDGIAKRVQGFTFFPQF